MTASKAKAPTQFASNNATDPLRRTNSQNSATIVKRQRGPINKRACQRCRLGKIKCDGDAEHNISCSNCDPDSCVYDTSPRKNKQVEQLKQRLSTLEEQLVSILQDVNDQLTEKNLEKEILFLLIDTKELFNGSEVLTNLKQLIRHGKCPKQLLIFIHELLQRMSKEHDKVHEIIDSLQNVLMCANKVCKDNESLLTIQSIPVSQITHQQSLQQIQHHQQQHHHQTPTTTAYPYNLVIPSHHQQNPNSNSIQSPNLNNNRHSSNNNSHSSSSNNNNNNNSSSSSSSDNNSNGYNNSNNNNGSFISSSPSSPYSTIGQFHSDHGSPEISELATEINENSAQVQYYIQYPYAQDFQMDSQIMEEQLPMDFNFFLNNNNNNNNNGSELM